MRQESVTLVVPLDYAFNVSREQLSLASCFTLIEAIDFIQRRSKGENLLACGNTEHPEQGMRAEDAIKLRKEIIEMLSVECQVSFTQATNSIDEAENIKRELDRQGVEVSEIHVFCDRFHAGRARLIWEYFFPNTNIVIHKVMCPWGSEQAQFAQRSTILWAIANYVAYFLMKVRGVESLRKIKQVS